MRKIGAGVLVFCLGAPALAGGSPPPAAFTEEAIARGVNYFTPERLSIERFGYGICFADLDGDRDPDLVVLGNAADTAGVYENDGTGTFIDRSATSGIPVLAGRSAVVAFDYDGDNDLDLYFTRIDQTNVLARNDGGFQFADVSAEALVDVNSRGTGPTVGDYDGDTWLDLHVPNYDRVDNLFHNRGDGTFDDTAPALGLDDPWRGWQAVFFDMDDDGDADLYVSNDKKIAAETVMHNRLYRNDGGTFVDISASSGTDVNIYSMGIGVGDFDGDGRQDLYCTNLSVESNAFLFNRNGALFTRDEVLCGIESYRTGWGASFLDYDNNGVTDLFVCNMNGPMPGSLGNNRLYIFESGWPSADIAPGLGLDDAADSFAVAVADIDDDGDLDIAVQNNDDNIRLYVNNEGSTRRWIKLDVGGQGFNRFAVGAQVRVRTGSTWRMREIIAGGNSFKSQNDLTVHVGLDDALVADEIVVAWPGGDTRTVTGVQTNLTWRIMPPERVGDVNDDGVVDVNDLIAMLAVWGPCIGCDEDGDLNGVVGVDDLLALLANWD